MTVVDSRDPGRKLVVAIEPVDATAVVLNRRGEELAERTRLLVLNESLGNSFGIRDTDAAESYRNVAENFGDVAKLLRDEMDRGRAILSAMTGDYRTVDDDNAAALQAAAEPDGAR